MHFLQCSGADLGELGCQGENCEQCIGTGLDLSDGIDIRLSGTVVKRPTILYKYVHPVSEDANEALQHACRLVCKSCVIL